LAIPSRIQSLAALGGTNITKITGNYFRYQGIFFRNCRIQTVIGDILKVLPKEYDLALVSDHGFERVLRGG